MKYFLSALLFAVVGCASVPPLVFEPLTAPEISVIYSNGVPFASASVDSVSFLLSLDRTTIAGDDYFRLWALCENLSDSTLLLEPPAIFNLVAVPKQTSEINQEFRMEPQSPAVLMNKIDNREALHTIAVAIGGALEAATTENTVASNSRGERYVIDDAAEKRDRIIEQTSASLNSISDWYSVYKSSLSSGILRKNTLFKNQSVNGYVYFRENMRTYSKSGHYFSDCDAEEFDYKLTVRLPGRARIIEFKITPEAW